MDENTTETEIVSKGTIEPEAGLYKASFKSPLNPKAVDPLNHLVQVVVLDNGSPEITGEIIDPVTRQKFKIGDKVVRHLPDDRGLESVVDFPKDPLEFISVSLDSLRYSNAPEGKEQGDMLFEPVEETSG